MVGNLYIQREDSAVGTLIGSLHAGPGSLVGFRAGFAVAATAMAVALAFAARVSDSDAAPKMADSERGTATPLAEAA